MRIAVFHELPVGGARRGVRELSKGLKKDHTVDLYIVGEKKDLKERHFLSHTFFYAFKPKVWLGNNWKVRLYKDSVELHKLHLLHQKIASEINKKCYDLFFVHGSQFTEAPYILRYAKLKKYFYCHDPHYRMLYENDLHQTEKSDPIRALYQKLNRFNRKRIDKKNFYASDIVIANSKYTQKAIQNTYKVSSEVGYLGVDTDFFIPDKRVAKTIDLLFIGSYQPVDGYGLLLDAIRLLKKKPKVRVVAIEDEWLSDVQIRKLYQMAKIVVCLAKNEPFGLVPLEAMACGLSVIAIDEGGYGESIINNESGILIRRSPRMLANAIKKLLESKNLRERLGVDARGEMVSNWSWEKSVHKLEGIFTHGEKDK